MRIFILSFLIFFPMCDYLAQGENDSLLAVWNNENIDDTLRFQALYNLSENYLFTKTDTALILAKKLLKQAQNKNNIEFEIDALTLLGKILFELDEADKGEALYLEGLKLAKEQNDSLIYADKLFRLGELYLDYEDFPNAFKILQESRQVCKLAGDSINEAWSIGYLGLINLELENWSEAERYFLEHLQISRKYNDKYGESGAKGNLGGVYERTKRYDKALEYWKAGIKLAKEGGWEEYASRGTQALVRIYTEKHEFENALHYLDEYKEVTKNYESPYYPIRIHLFECKIDYGLANYTKALKEAEECLELLKVNEIQYKESYLRDLYECLYLINKSLNQFDKALYYNEAFNSLKDSLRIDKDRTEFQRFLFNTQLVTDSIEQAKEKQLLYASYAEDMRRKNLEKNFFLVIGVMVLLLAAGMYHRLRYIKRTKEQLNIEKNRAEKSEQIKQDFLANMSHEIRTPMNAMLGMTNLVMDMPLEEKQRYYLNGIKKSGDNLLHIINDILDLSKIEAGKMDLDEIDFSLIETLDQVKQILQHRADEKNLELIVNIDDETPDIVLGDPFRLNQILINLMGNAIKFTQRGSVCLEVQNEENGVQFNIIDTGIGIAKEKLDNIFESFSQANTSDTRKYGGTGLGLSISQQLVEMMGSSINVESKEGYGSTFSFVLKFKEGSINRLKERIAADESIDGAILDGLKILLVDDNEYNIIVARDTLKSKSKLNVDEAYNGKEAIKLLKKNEYDVILMDVQMPVMNGFDATKYIRSEFKAPINEIPIIALTASVLRSDLDKCIDAGMNSYIPKPFKAHQLIREIASALAIPINTIVKSEAPVEINHNGKVSNLNYLHKFCEGDKDRMKKYIGIFNTSSPTIIEKIKLALYGDDFEEIANQVHGFKTHFIMMGMSASKEKATLIELACRNNDPDKAFINKKVLELISEIKEAQKELKTDLEDESI